MKKAEKAIDLLGLARRAGKLVLGAGATEAAFGRRAVCALILASDIAPRSAAKVTRLAQAARVPCYTFGSKDEFGRRFGRDEIGILGLLDRSFVSALDACVQRVGHSNPEPPPDRR
jgi:ribosomal protein L7Ae-like RNA K-turn-binding protein